MDKENEELYLKASDIAQEYAERGKKLDKDGAAIILVSLKPSHGRPFGTNFLGGNKQMVCEMLAGACIQSKEIKAIMMQACLMAELQEQQNNEKS